MRRYFANNLPQIWQDKTHPVSKLLYPLSLVYGAAMSVRRLMYKTGMLKSQAAGVPVVIVGNITVGGTGKTPLVVWLGEYFQSAGFKPGIISKGYGGSSPDWPVDVTDLEKPEMVGDEAVMLRRKTGLPVVVSPSRIQAARMLIDLHNVDLVISDDGLQHLSLKRDLEIVVIDAKRLFGNNRLLPSGPLRDSPNTISARALKLFRTDDDSDQHKYWMKYHPVRFRNVKLPSQTKAVNEFEGIEVNAVAGIGYPEKFFQMLENLGIRINRYNFPDHHIYTAQDITFTNSQPLIMTEKDAVKCIELVNSNTWYLEITAAPNKSFEEELDSFVGSIKT